MKHKHITIQHIGEEVACDICNEDFTNSEESGGFLFDGGPVHMIDDRGHRLEFSNGDYAYCPTCAKTSMARLIGYGEDKYIKEHCPEGMSFRDWVLKLRKGDNTIKTISVEDK